MAFWKVRYPVEVCLNGKLLYSVESFYLVLLIVVDYGHFIRWQIETVNISSEHILDGNPKITLGLVWRLILHFQVNTG